MPNWVEDLDDFLTKHRMSVEAKETRKKQNQAKVTPYFEETIIPALRKLAEEFQRRGKSAFVDAKIDSPDKTFASITLGPVGEWRFEYRIQAIANSRLFSPVAIISSTAQPRTTDDDFDGVLGSSDPQTAIINKVISAWEEAIVQESDSKE